MNEVEHRQLRRRFVQYISQEVQLVVYCAICDSLYTGIYNYAFIFSKCKQVAFKNTVNYDEMITN